MSPRADRLALVTTPTPTPTADPADDAALVDRATAGSVEAFEALYRRHAGRVYALALRLTADPVRARELTQDTFVTAWRRLATFERRSAFASWLHRVAVNSLLAGGRADRRRESRVRLADDAGVDALARGPDVEQQIDLERAIAALPPGARRVFVLHDVAGFRHDEIARMTGSAEGTLRAQLHRARKLLLEALTR